MSDLWEKTRKEEKLAILRKKWLEAKKKEDTALMGIYERQARVIKELG